jgi:hypothetical protein
MEMVAPLDKAGSEELLGPDALLNIGTGKPKPLGALPPAPATPISPAPASCARAPIAAGQVARSCMCGCMHVLSFCTHYS